MDASATAIPIGTEATPPFIRQPDARSVFARRAERCRTLAEGHPLQPYLLFIADLASAQHAALHAAAGVPFQGNAGSNDGRPLLERQGWRTDTTWTDRLRVVLDRLLAGDLSLPARDAAAALAQRSWVDLVTLGERVLDGTCEAADAVPGCFVMAALQVAWTGAASRADAADVERLEDGPRANGGLCPMCGSPPVVSVVHAGGNLHGARFLHCALCSTQWHFVRIKCPACSSTKGIAHHQIEGGRGAVKAETCDACGTYTKILYLEKDHRMEPFADDLASCTLDVLVDEAGWRRATPNPFLMPIPD